MPKNRAVRILYALVVVALLGIIGRNVSHRYLTSHLLTAVNSFAPDVAAVRSLLAKGADPNSRLPPETKSSKGTLEKGTLALEYAMHCPDFRWPDLLSREQEEVACLLIQHGADISRERGYACLSAVCSEGSIAVARCLLEHGADPNAPDVGYALPVDAALLFASATPYNTPPAQLEAVKQQRRSIGLELVRLLREHGARLTLWQAARMDDVEALRALLDTGTPVDQTEARGRATALSCAAAEGNINAVRLLLARGASVVDVGYNALGAAIAGRHLEVARLLLQKGASVNPPRSKPMLVQKGGAAPASAPARSINPPRIEPMLVQACRVLPALVPDLLRHEVDWDTWGDEALKAAISNHHPGLVPLLLPYVARQQKGWGHGALRMALQYQPDLVPLLLARGARAREKSNNPTSLIGYALRYGRANLILSLLRAGANANVPDGDTTPLMEAVGQNVEAVRLLLEAGADPNEIVGSGRTPLIGAAQAGNVETIKLLLAHGAKINGEGKLHHTPLYYAQRRKRPDVIAILQQAGGKAK